MKNANQIRQLLEAMVKISNTGPRSAADTVYGGLATKALGLLSCETCNDIEKLEAALKPILEGSVTMPPYDDGKSPESIGFFGDLHLDTPENAYHFGFQTALLECGEIIAKALEKGPK